MIYTELLVFCITICTQFVFSVGTKYVVGGSPAWYFIEFVQFTSVFQYFINSN